MFGSLSTLGKIQRLQAQTDLNSTRISTLAGLYGISGASEATLSRALKGGKGLDPKTDEELGKLIRKIEGYLAAVHPIQPSFAQPEKIKELLDSLEKGSLYVIAVQVSPKPDEEGGLLTDSPSGEEKQ